LVYHPVYEDEMYQLVDAGLPKRVTNNFDSVVSFKNGE
jgi:hypothetical protein